MVDRGREFEGKSLKEVAAMMAEAAGDTFLFHAGEAEFLLRQTELQERSARAVEKTAQDTARYTRYVFYSVLFLAVSAFGPLLVEMWRLHACNAGAGVPSKAADALPRPTADPKTASWASQQGTR